MNNLHYFEQQIISAIKQFIESTKSGSAVTFDITPIIEATNNIPLSNLERWEWLIRSELNYEYSSNSRILFWKKRTKPLTWLDLISWDGYKREAALKIINGPAPNRFFMALAIRRLNDWVKNVRVIAEQKLPSILEGSDHKDIADVLFITLLHWNSWGRIEQSGKKILLDATNKEKVASILKDKIISSSSGPMPSLLAQISRSSALDKHFESIAKNAIQPSVRARAYRSIMENQVTWIEGRQFVWIDRRYSIGKTEPIIGTRTITTDKSFCDILDQAADDPSSIVRRVAAEFLRKEHKKVGDKANEMAQIFSMDKSLAVSERGKFALKHINESSIQD